MKTDYDFPGYRVLEEWELIQDKDMFLGFSGRLVPLCGGAAPQIYRDVPFVTKQYENIFWRHILTEERDIGCDHPQEPDDQVPGWLRRMPCPYPICPAGQTGGLWHVHVPSPKMSLAEALAGEPNVYKILTYVSEPVFAHFTKPPKRRLHYRWVLSGTVAL